MAETQTGKGSVQRETENCSWSQPLWNASSFPDRIWNLFLRGGGGGWGGAIQRGSWPSRGYLSHTFVHVADYPLQPIRAHASLPHHFFLSQFCFESGLVELRPILCCWDLWGKGPLCAAGVSLPSNQGLKMREVEGTNRGGVAFLQKTMTPLPQTQCWDNHGRYLLCHTYKRYLSCYYVQEGMERNWANSYSSFRSLLKSHFLQEVWKTTWGPYYVLPQSLSSLSLHLSHHFIVT